MPALGSIEWIKVGNPFAPWGQLYSLALDDQDEPIVAVSGGPVQVWWWRQGDWSQLPPLPEAPAFNPCLAFSGGALYLAVSHWPQAAGQKMRIVVYRWDPNVGWTATNLPGQFAPATDAPWRYTHGRHPVIAPDGDGGLCLAYLGDVHYEQGDFAVTTTGVYVYRYSGLPLAWSAVGGALGVEFADTGQPQVGIDGAGLPTVAAMLWAEGSGGAPGFGWLRSYVYRQGAWNLDVQRPYSEVPRLALGDRSACLTFFPAGQEYRLVYVDSGGATGEDVATLSAVPSGWYEADLAWAPLLGPFGRHQLREGEVKLSGRKAPLVARIVDGPFGRTCAVSWWDGADWIGSSLGRRGGPFPSLPLVVGDRQGAVVAFNTRDPSQDALEASNPTLRVRVFRVRSNRAWHYLRS